MTALEGGIVWTVAAGTALVAAGMLLHLAGRLLFRSRARVQDELDAAVLDGFQAGPADESLARRLRRAPPRAARRSLVHALAALGEDRRADVEALYAALDFERGAARDLKSLFWHQRAEAAIELGAFRRSDWAPQIVVLLRSRRSETRLAAARALADLRPPGALRMVLESIPSCTRWAIGDTVELAGRFGPEAVPDLHAILRDTPVRPARLGAIEALGELPDPASLPVLGTLLEDRDMEARVAAARSIGRIGGPEAPGLLARALEDKAWEVRAAAARSLAQTREPAAVPSLQNALNDPAWWVRLNAADGLAAFEGAGEASLREALRGRDTFARDTAAQALAQLRPGGEPA